MPDPETFANGYNALQDKTISQLEADYLKSVRATIKATDWEKLDSDLAAYRNGDEIVDGIAWEDYNPKERLSKLVSVSLDAHGAYIGDVVGGAGFDLVDPNALKWIDDYAAQEIKYISGGSKDAIRQIIKNGYEKGITVDQQARQIREHIGLDPRRSATLEKYADNLFSKGMDEAEVWRLVEKKGKALLSQRALTIAVNEASEAGGRATYESTKNAVERGIIDPYLYEAFRIITADERTCAVCNAVAGESRKLPDGVYPSTGSQIAKKHTRCRCVEGLREITMKKKEMRESGRTKTEVSFEAKALKRKDGVIYCPTVPLVEGVFEGLGFPVLRLYEEFSKDAHWLDGLTVLTNHEDLNPNARRIGKLSDTQSRPEKKDVTATTRFFESDLTPKEVEAITSKQPLHGSLSLSYNLEQASGEWNGKHYEAIERGPYVFYEYSLVRQGVVTPKDGAGFNMECKNCKSLSSAPGGADSMEMEDIQKMIEEAQKPLAEKIAALEQENIALKGEQNKVQESIETDRKARIFEAFQAKLKPGHQEKAAELYEAYQKDPAGWVMENADKFIQAKESKTLKGSAVSGDAPVWSLEQERQKMKSEGKVI